MSASSDIQTNPSDEVKVLAATTALNAMFAGKHFNICVIDRAAKVLGVKVHQESYDVLHALHCIDWHEMPADLREAVPGLVEKALVQGGVAFRFQTPMRAHPAPGSVIEIDSPKRRTLLQRLVPR